MASDQPSILLIDDTTEIRWVHRSVLEGAGYHVLVTDDNDEALFLLETHRSEIRLVIQDCDRPLGRCLGGDRETPYADSGVRFYRCILAVRFPEIPAIFLSGRAEDLYRHEVDIPIYEKPMGEDALVCLVRRSLSCRANQNEGVIEQG